MATPTVTADDYAWALARALGHLRPLQREHIIKLYQVFAQGDVTEGARRAILQAIAVHPGSLADREVSPAILANNEQSAALARDYMLMMDGAPDDDLVRSFISATGMASDQVRVLRDWVVLENKVLRAMGAGDEWMADEQDWRELGARATGVGLPVAALYFAGVTGFSAVGLTSGLAAIGGTAGAALVALGLNPMTAGIAVLIAGGIGVKKVSDYALGVNSQRAAHEQAQARRRELLVNTVALLAADREALPALVGPVMDPRPLESLRQAMGGALDGLRRYAARGTGNP